MMRAVGCLILGLELEPAAPPRMPGFCCVRGMGTKVGASLRRIAAAVRGSPMPTRPPLHRAAGWQSATAVKRRLDRLRPSASARGYGASVAPGAGGVPRAASALRGMPGRDVWCRRRWSTTWCRIGGDWQLFWDETTGRACASAATTARPRARAAGVDEAADAQDPLG